MRGGIGLKGIQVGPFVQQAYDVSLQLLQRASGDSNRPWVRRSHVVAELMKGQTFKTEASRRKKAKWWRTLVTNAFSQLEVEGFAHHQYVKVSEAKTGSGQLKVWSWNGRAPKSGAR